MGRHMGQHGRAAGGAAASVAACRAMPPDAAPPGLMAHTVRLPSGHVISDDRARLDMAFVQRSLAGVSWAANRPPALTERSWAHCLCFGVYAPGGAPVGFARLLTDYALRAHLGDVFIHPLSRGLGLGKALVDTILGHPELSTIWHWTLTTADAHGLYARYGFRAGAADGAWMTLDRTPPPTPPSIPPAPSASPA